MIITAKNIIKQVSPKFLTYLARLPQPLQNVCLVEWVRTALKFFAG